MTDSRKIIALIPAGEFSRWLRDAETVVGPGAGGADVPCGTCTACCRSAMFIHVRPDETRTLQRIPRALLSSAPGLPAGHMVMGYTDNGHCPMFRDDRCSIYADRPQACRDYDCRIFAATGVSVDRDQQPEIAARVDAWTFEYESEASREAHRRLRAVAIQLAEKRHLIGAWKHPASLSALTLRVHARFGDLTGAENSEILDAIRAIMKEPATHTTIAAPARRRTRARVKRSS